MQCVSTSNYFFFISGRKINKYHQIPFNLRKIRSFIFKKNDMDLYENIDSFMSPLKYFLSSGLGLDVSTSAALNAAI